MLVEWNLILKMVYFVVLVHELALFREEKNPPTMPSIRLSVGRQALWEEYTRS